MNIPHDTNEQRPEARIEPRDSPDWLTRVRQQVETLRFGQIQITVHDGRVVQLELTERIRLDASRTPRSLR